MKALAVVALLLASRVAAADDSMQCKDGIVRLGARPGEVEDKCGAPTHAEHYEHTIVIDWGAVVVTLDVWTYDFGPNSFIRILTFQDGVLQTIVLGGYGKPR